MELLNQLNQAASAIAISAALVIFIVANITPGPNNLMLMVSGVRIGLRRTLPHIWGILVGVFLLVIGLGLVLDTAADFFPPILLILRFIFSAILLWLAYKIATAPTSEEEDSSFPIPFGFWRALLFQWVNSKAWAVHTFIIVSCGSGNPTTVTSEALVIALLGTPIALAGTFSWTLFGVSLRGWLREPKRARIFYGVMGGALSLIVLFLWIEPILKWLEQG